MLGLGGVTKRVGPNKQKRSSDILQIVVEGEGEVREVKCLRRQHCTTPVTEASPGLLKRSETDEGARRYYLFSVYRYDA